MQKPILPQKYAFSKGQLVLNPNPINQNKLIELTKTHFAFLRERILLHEVLEEDTKKIKEDRLLADLVWKKVN